MPLRRQRRAPWAGVSAFEWAEADPEVTLLAAVAELDDESPEPRLVVTAAGGAVQHLAPLPGPRDSQGGDVILAFRVDATIAEHPETRFELAVDTFRTALPVPVRADRAGDDIEEPGVSELNDRLRRLRHEMHDTRRRLGEAEERADDAYLNQVMAEERSAEARATARELATRIDELENTLAASREEAAGLTRQLTLANEQVAELDQAMAAQRGVVSAGEAESARLDAELRKARDTLAASREEAAALTRQLTLANEQVAGLDQSMAAQRGVVSAGEAESARLGAELREARDTLGSSAEEVAALTRQLTLANEQVAELDQSMAAQRGVVSAGEAESARLGVELGEAREEAGRLRAELELVQDAGGRMEAELQRSAKEIAELQRAGS